MQCLIILLPKQCRLLMMVDRVTAKFGVCAINSDLLKKCLAVCYISVLLPKSPHWLILWSVSLSTSPICPIVSHCFFLKSSGDAFVLRSLQGPAGVGRWEVEPARGRGWKGNRWVWLPFGPGVGGALTLLVFVSGPIHALGIFSHLFVCSLVSFNDVL